MAQSQESGEDDESGEYQVTYEAFKHIYVEADSKEEALEKADPYEGSWERDGERVEDPY